MPGVPATDENEGECGLAQRRVGLRRRDVEPVEHLVAQGDRLFDVLEPGGLLGQARDRERPGDRAERDDDLVVGELVVGALLGHHLGDLAVVVDTGDATGDHPAALEGLAERHHHVPRFHRAGRRFGQERLVRHHRAGVDHGDPDLAPASGLPQAVRGVHPDVTASDDEDVRYLGCHCLHSP